MADFKNCTQVTPECPISATTYGYAPNKAANGTLLVLFAICCVAQVILGIRKRTWTFLASLTTGCAMEFLGYLGRLQMSSNPWNKSAYTLQITLLILAPSFIAAGIYLCVKHIVLHLGPEFSKLKPRLFTWIFISCDIFSFVIQGAGGGIAASSGNNLSMLQTGNDIMIAGICFQVVTMTLCGIIMLDLSRRYYRHHGSQLLGVSTGEPRHVVAGFDRKTRFFCVAVAFSYVLVLIRCFYRVPEMAGGWGNPLMRNETEFLILDGSMMTIAAITLIVFHPGYWLPVRSDNYKKFSKHIHEMHPISGESISEQHRYQQA